MVDAGLTVIQDSIGSATPENMGELIKFSHANNNNNNNTTQINDLLRSSACDVRLRPKCCRLDRKDHSSDSWSQILCPSGDTPVH